MGDSATNHSNNTMDAFILGCGALLKQGLCGTKVCSAWEKCRNFAVAGLIFCAGGRTILPQLCGGIWGADDLSRDRGGRRIIDLRSAAGGAAARGQSALFAEANAEDDCVGLLRREHAAGSAH